MRFRVDIVHPETGLPMYQHAGEIDSVAVIEFEDLLEEVDLWLAVEAIVIEVKCSVPRTCILGRAAERNKKVS